MSDSDKVYRQLRAAHILDRIILWISVGIIVGVAYKVAEVIGVRVSHGRM
jgi:hypothetical protein